jgi:ribosomal protein S18 acetylase RimI-like enzyme
VYRSESFRPAIHQVAGFDCGVDVLNTWLQRSAAQEAAKRSAHTFVWVQDVAEVVAYYAICAHSLSRSAAPSRIGRGVADPIPAALIAKLALSTKLQGQGLGGDLLRDALERIIRASLAGPAVRAIVVDPIDNHAAAFYRRYGFTDAPTTPPRLLMRFDSALRSLATEPQAPSTGDPA